MASFTVITVKGEGHLGVTVDESVGIGGLNKRSDVMLVQALMAYIIPLRIMDINDGIDVPEIPRLTGQYDFETDSCIDYYQRSRSHKVMEADGRIDAPSYGRKVGSGSNAKWVQRNLVNINGNKLMTMTVLHFEARKAARQYAHGRYTTGLTIMFPQLRSQLRGSDHERMHWLK